jgi:hypothetical protein
VDWIIREHDRKVAALEMESAGVYDAATVRTTAPRTVAIRGISDYADARKEKLKTQLKVSFEICPLETLFRFLFTLSKLGCSELRKNWRRSHYRHRHICSLILG